MKWYKHYTDSLSDPFIEELMDNFSHAGYVAWFGLIEIICKENGNKLTGKLEISPTYLKRKLRISQGKLRQIFGFCATNGKLLFDFSQEKWSFDFPKIAEIKDNYTKDLQVTDKKPSKQKEKEVEKEVEKEKEKDIKTAHKISFSEFWEIAPARNGKKIGKTEAEKKFMKLKSSDLANVIVATHHYADSEMVKQGIGIKDPHRFLSNKDNKEYWKEWIEPENKSKIISTGYQSRSERNAAAKAEILEEINQGARQERDVTPNRGELT